MLISFEPGLGGVVSLEPQPFLQCLQPAPKSQWVMVEALWYRPSDWVMGLRLLRGRFGGKGAVGGMSPFPVAGSPETTPPRPGLKQALVAMWACTRKAPPLLFRPQASGRAPGRTSE
jgi:hypothetical protein